jgi:hypothetical protein
MRTGSTDRLELYMDATANSANPASIISMCLPVLPAKTSPNGTDRLTIHNTRWLPIRPQQGSSHV